MDCTLKANTSIILFRSSFISINCKCYYFLSFYYFLTKSEKQPVLSAQLLYPLITATSFDRVFGGKLFREDELQISSILGKGEYGQVYTAFINGTKVAAKEIALPLKVPKTAEIKVKPI